MLIYTKRVWKLWMAAFICAAPLAAILIMGEYRLPWDLLEVPWWYWCYSLVAGFFCAYLHLRYWDKPK